MSDNSHEPEPVAFIPNAAPPAAFRLTAEQAQKIADIVVELPWRVANPIISILTSLERCE